MHAVHVFDTGSRNGVAVGQDAKHVFDAGSYAGVAVGQALHTFVNVLVNGVDPEQVAVHVVPPPEL